MSVACNQDAHRNKLLRSKAARKACETMTCAITLTPKARHDAANQSTPQGAEGRSRSTLVCQLRRLAGAGALVRGRAQSVGLKPMCGNSGEICTCRARTKAKAPKKRRSQRRATQESTVTQCLCRFTALLHLLLRSIAQIAKETNPSILRKAVLAALCVKARRSATTRNSPYQLTSAKCRQGRNATRACKDRRTQWQERPSQQSWSHRPACH